MNNVLLLFGEQNSSEGHMSNEKSKDFLFSGFLNNATLFKAVRNELGLTQKEIADKLGWTDRQVSYVESGERDLQKQTILALESLVIKNNKLIALNKKGIHFKDQKIHYTSNLGSLICDFIHLDSSMKKEKFNYKNTIIFGDDKSIFESIYDQSKKIKNCNSYKYSFKAIEGSHVNELQKTLNIVVDEVDNNNPVNIFIEDFALDTENIDDDLTGLLSIFKFSRRLNMSFIIDLAKPLEVSIDLEKFIDDVFTYKIKPINKTDVISLSHSFFNKDDVGFALKDEKSQLKYFITRGCFND